MAMFCRQCEQTASGQKCALKGVCGKDDEVSALQDLLIYALRGIAFFGHRAKELGVGDKKVDLFTVRALFATVTNVDFDQKRLKELIYDSVNIRKIIKNLFLKVYRDKNGSDFSQSLPPVAEWTFVDDHKTFIRLGLAVNLGAQPDVDPDRKSLREIILYGLKGMAAYADHAFILGSHDPKMNAFFYKALDALGDDSLAKEDLLALVMELGTENLRCMEILDKAHTNCFGHPVPSKVSLGVSKGPAIIISGHDLLDLFELLKQTEGKGISIYTHGEMLAAHGYPQLNKYPHLKGHFGTAWQAQQEEFDDIPAAILMTTNCIQKPKSSYSDRIFTTGLVAFPGIAHIGPRIKSKDFTLVINKALELEGFKEEKIEKEILVGFAHKTVLGVADKVIEAVKAGKIKHFFLIGGCDGAKPGRNYYTEFAQKVPKDCVILTLACGKFRINRLDYGDIDGIPRLLDCGQCNDAYSAIKIALALAEAFKCGVNDLPLSLILSWYEQKAVAILLTLLSLGIKNIRLGPSLPAFVSENVLKILIEKFNIKPIASPDEDLKQILGGNDE